MSILKTPIQNNRKLQFLIVEDDKSSQESLKLILTSIFACEIYLTDTGEDGIRLSDNHLFDLILINIGLPDMDGFTVTKIIRQTESKNQHTPIIATSGCLQELEHCFKVGINAFLLKPFGIKELKKSLKKLGFSVKV